MDWGSFLLGLACAVPVGWACWNLGDWQGSRRVRDDMRWATRVLREWSPRRTFYRSRHRRPRMHSKLAVFWHKTRPRTPQEVSRGTTPQVGS